MKHLLIIAMAATFAASIASAGQSSGKVTLPVNRTSPTNGKLMFTNYCAPCHGMDGRGNGPVAAALKVPPTNLTVLSRNNHGKFPDTHITSVLENGSDLPAHGTAEMPVWGPILGGMNQTNPQEKLLRISNLTRFLETVQSK
jgi:mono/diheme cytochrome c family protein